VFFAATACCKQKFKKRPLELLRLCFAGMMSSLASTRLTFAWRSNSLIRELCRALAEGRTTDRARGVSLFPPSRAHETELIKKLYGDQPIPEGFDLGDEMVKRLRAGTLDLNPNPASGWYDHQTYALQALAVLEGMPEGKHLTLNESYREELVGLFKALLALTRETHVKQLEVPLCGSALGHRPLKVKLYIAPDLTLEPLATYYFRRARSYQFVRDVLMRSFGPEGLEKMRRLTPDGPVNLPLGEEIHLMQVLFHGAYLQPCGEIGMTPGSEPGLGNGKDANAHRAILKAWLASIRKDPDLGRDVRMMVPIFYDLGRQKTKVWMVLGIATKPLKVSYVTPPLVKGMKGPDRRDVKSSDVEVNFTLDYHQAAYFATAEVYVARLLDRTEFREHCARHKPIAQSSASSNSLALALVRDDLDVQDWFSVTCDAILHLVGTAWQWTRLFEAN
jgi:hypothetical protein